MSEFAPYDTGFVALCAVLRFGAALVEHNSDFTLLVFIAERTAGWNKIEDTISQSQFDEGILRQDGGELIRSGCGLKPTARKESLIRLRRRGLIIQKRHRTKRLGDLPTDYSIDWKRFASLAASIGGGPEAVKRPPRGRKTTLGEAVKRPHSSDGYRSDRTTASQPATSTVGNTPQAGRLAEVSAIMTRAWPKLVGLPGKKLLERVAGILGDTPLAEYHALLYSKRRKVESFGLAESLACELHERRNGNDGQRKRSAQAQHDRDAAERAEQIKTLKALRDNPKTPANERAEIQSMLDGLRRKPKPETKKSARGAA